jgi:hypothetical protein
MPPLLPGASCACLLVLVAASTSAPASDAYAIPPAKQKHWAWQQPALPRPPAVRDSAWVQNPIDCFILAKLEAAGLQAAHAASRTQLIRRVTLDLIGLPPTPEEIDAFVADRSAGAWERVIDRLLASPHYGERWGRHWLDLARFAESNGFEFDEARPDAWRYRDYVIASFNADKPYDRFIADQLAGDELFPDDPAALIATGFNLLGPDMTDSSDQAKRRQDRLNDMTDTTSLVFLGLTIGCARCHDHKFEPIPQTDYYRLQAFVAPAVFRHDLPIATRPQRLAYDHALRDYQVLIKPSQEALARLEEPYRRKLHEARLARLSDEARAAHQTPAAKRTPTQQELVEKTKRLLGVSSEAILAAMSAADKAKHAELRQQIQKLDGKKPTPLPVAMGLSERSGKAPPTFLLERGELSQRGEEVLPGFPIILTADFKARPAEVKPLRPASTGRRAALARWIACKDNPLTARVLANRLWQHHFGRGLVATPSDLGVRGERPMHPELLDWLATVFMTHGWSIKHMHKLMLSSATYQQASKPSPQALLKDRDNRLLSHMRRQRLEGEVIRDCLLAVSGRLNPRMGGPGVFPSIPESPRETAKDWKTSPDPRDHIRRSVYIFARRNLRFPFLETFDLPDNNLSCPKRERSTTAPQALTLLNDADVMRAAEALAARLTAAATDNEQRITLAYRLVLGRRPSAREAKLAGAFLLHSPLPELCRALFNVTEFVYPD